MSFAQALFLAVLQGVSELFPVSSLGHTVIIPALLHWKVDRSDPTFLAFVVVLHLGTAIALVVFYWREWVAIIGAFVGSVVRGKFSESRNEKVAWLLIAGTIPVGLLGIFFQKSVKLLFSSPMTVSLFLVANAFVMFLGERLRSRQQAAIDRPNRPLEALSWQDAVKVGFAQSLALLPGISRSGSSIVAGLLLDLDHEDAAKYSFLLATPVILAAGVLELPELFAPNVHLVLVQSIVGALVAGVTAYASVAFLTKYFQHNDLRPFGWYCLIVGLISFTLFATKVV